MYVKRGVAFSRNFHVINGLRQGDVSISPLLLNVHVNEVLLLLLLNKIY